MEEDIYISSLARLTVYTIMRPQTGFHQAIPTKNSTISREPGLLTSQQDKFSVFLISNANKLIQLRKWSTFVTLKKWRNATVNVDDLNQWEQQTSLKVGSFDGLKQEIILPINHRETGKHLIEQNIDLFAEKDTDLGKTNMIKMSIDTG